MAGFGFDGGDEKKQAPTATGPRMIWDPRCWLHVILVEYRWIWLLYYTFYVLVMTTGRAVDYALEGTGEYMEMYAACDGLQIWSQKHSDLLRDRMWSYESIDYKWEATDGICHAQAGPCRGATLSDPKDCRLSDTMGEMENVTFYINCVIAVCTLPFGLGLSLYQICCRRGQFDRKFTANKDYVASLHSIQIKKWYRTYTNFVFFMILPIAGYGFMRLMDADAAQTDKLQFIVGVIALIQLVPSPRRIAPTEDLEYDSEEINEERSSCSAMLVKVTNWTSTDYHENYDRIKNMKDGDKDWEEMKNLCEVPCIC